MAKAPKGKKEAAPAPKKQKADPGRGGVARPVSLYPLSFEDAVDALLEVKMEPGELKGGRKA